jgi:hypothetical protein
MAVGLIRWIRRIRAAFLVKNMVCRHWMALQCLLSPISEKAAYATVCRDMELQVPG